ncbi:hypothetical protein M5689_018664 [Euphorbia peplus]|nr:hypothetical protein M5689_018664 [Euphorbia peplus]
MISELIEGANIGWNRDLLCHTFSLDDVSEILKIKIGPHLPPDALHWGPNRSGDFTVKSCDFLINNVRFAWYSMASPSTADPELFHKLWSLKLPPKFSIFVVGCPEISCPIVRV